MTDPIYPFTGFSMNFVISTGECNTIVSAYLCIGTYNSIALTSRYGDHLNSPPPPPPP